MRNDQRSECNLNTFKSKNESWFRNDNIKTNFGLHINKRRIKNYPKEIIRQKYEAVSQDFDVDNHFILSRSLSIGRMRM